MVSPHPFPYGAIGPLVLGLRCRLGRCLTIRPLQNGYPRRIIIKFGRAFEMCDREGQNFGWFTKWGFGIVYSTPQFDGFIALPVFLQDIEDLEESSNEED
ncbi:hypothetical protein M9H77_26988 [Catharanthus roseus]|uniref:Uncharacterized protein n=1 Tax=Catharanthus roseus TaxID=4058 RepID=A0ACC0ABE7_CATRO|nr:hypothetical protein M9H77_26988 [Catharanthus roseus]